MDGDNSYDVAIICALAQPELAKLRQIDRDSWTSLEPDFTDPTSYYQTSWTSRKQSKIRVVAAAPNHVGLPSAASLATKMILRFRPKLVAIVGIAAGLKTEKVGFGDVLAASDTFDYGAGKVEEVDGIIRFLPDPAPIPIDARLHQRLKAWDRSVLHKIRDEWQAKQPQTALHLHVGPLASGAAVVNSNLPVQQILLHWRKVVGLEMEAHGVHRAASDTRCPAPMFLCLKSVADFAQNKGDDWQDFAAYTAARCCYHFLIDEWEQLFQPSTNP